MVLYILIFMCLERRQEDKRLKRIVASIPQTLSALNFSVNTILICYCFPKYLKFATFSKDLLAISKL